MDTSEIFIKMCDYEEIQDWIEGVDLDEHSFFWIVTKKHYCENCGQHGDGMYCNQCGKKLKVKEGGYIDNQKYDGRKSIWLPRQDQIQEMCGTYHNDKNGKWFCWVCTLSRFDRFLEGFLNREFDHEIECFNKQREFKMASMEQLWLAFYMSEKHNLKWDGSKWVKTTT